MPSRKHVDEMVRVPHQLPDGHPRGFLLYTIVMPLLGSIPMWSGLMRTIMWCLALTGERSHEYERRVDSPPIPG